MLLQKRVSFRCRLGKIVLDIRLHVYLYMQLLKLIN
jgi:hypothetical protein